MTTQNTAQDHAGIVEVEGAQLRYRMEGHGPPCLVVGSSVFYHEYSGRTCANTCN